MAYKIRFGYWARQPVFHYYHLFYWLNPPGVIEKERVKISKYYQPQIIFKEFNKLSTEKKELFAALIKSHFLPYKCEKYSPTTENIIDNFQNHSRPSYIALYYDTNRLVSSLTTIPINIYFSNGKVKQEIYYADFLCVHPKFRKQDVAKKVINTVSTNHRLKDHVHKRDTSILFKREGKSMFIVPLTVYRNYVFDITKWDRNITLNDFNFIQLVTLTKKTSTLFVDLLNKSIYKFNCVLHQDLTNIMYLCEKKEMLITMLLVNNNPVCFYVFRDPFVTYNDSKSIETIASYNDNTTDEIFTLGFLYSVQKFNMKYNKLLITDSGHNNIILNIILKKYTVDVVTIGSFYFYNYATYPLMSYDVLTLL